MLAYSKGVSSNSSFLAPDTKYIDSLRCIAFDFGIRLKGAADRPRGVGVCELLLQRAVGGQDNPGTDGELGCQVGRRESARS